MDKQQQQQQQPLPRNLHDNWIQHQRNSSKTTQSFACPFCSDHRIFLTTDELWKHATELHHNELPEDETEWEAFRSKFEAEASLKRPREDSLRKPTYNDASMAGTEPVPAQKRPLSNPVSIPIQIAPTRSLSQLKTLNLSGTYGNEEDVPMKDVSEDNQPRKRAAIGDGISAGSASPIPFRDSPSPPPRRSKARPTSATYRSISETGMRRPRTSGEGIPRPHVEKRTLWTPDQEPLTRGSLDPPTSNIASIQAKKSRRPFQPPQQAIAGSRNSGSQSSPNTIPATIFDRTSNHSSSNHPKDESYDIVLQPETRPISQEQLVAEVKGIYAGLVMVEAKCIEVDNKQATLASADPGAQPKLNNEQWQALIALHRTLLHEHHDFFLASQHPSASPALRRLASKYAMPARMWRHGIHSFLELLRHRLPASLDHMLAFIYLAYSMMALLYETVPAFEDTWIECLGDLGRYRMAIEDDDIRDREVWTGVARHWYSKASDKSPTTGRLYHHLAILARPNALQQLFYYSKSLCVAVPFTSARESILTLFDPVLNADGGQGQYRLPPLDTAFIKSHGLLFMDKELETRFEPAMKDFSNLLDSQIGRVTRKFMEQGYQIAIANCVQILGFASKENVLMRAISSSAKDDADVGMDGISSEELSLSFKNAQRLTNATLEIVLQRIGDPNVLPFIHVTLVFMYHMSRHAGAMSILRASFPWEPLATMLNTLLVFSETTGPIESDEFPSPEKDDVRPLPEDFALRGLLWAEDYFPAEWFTNEKIDEEEKYHERASMTAQRKERILWLAVRIAKGAGSGLNFDSGKNDNKRPGFSAQIEQLASRANTFESIASATTNSSIDRHGTWPPDQSVDDDCPSDGEDNEVNVPPPDPLPPA
ncbi:esl2 [Hyphodiscus hymeniophilus]|uniref:Nonsense-mediated mRNA decay factor n=1 Tax=Hyphodiscus hymeniophilus TaxID=353542 RepID=A0A9P6VLR9_9HELO|nr:esl2 [Hyphodiscus hymeniophilus]